jgi:FkbM family methyltransferase
MSANKYLPLFWKRIADSFPGGKSMVLNIMGSKMAIRPGSYDLVVLGEVFWEQVYVPRFIRIKAPDVIVDLGANIGAFSVWAAKRWDPGKIVAVEMEKDNFNLLEENIRLNGLCEKVIPVKSCIWDENGQVGIKKHPFNHGMHQGCMDTRGGGVAALTMEKLLDMVKVRKIDVLKMDIEGAEERIFNKKNERLFAQGVGTLLAELHPTRGVQVKRMVEVLEKTGFEVNIRRQWLRTTVLLEAVNRHF